MYKLVISSFDNTLINSEEAISSSTMVKIDEIRRNNILFGISTNRCYKDVLSYNRDFPFIDYIIAYNGAYVYDVNKNKVIFKKNILISIIKKIFNNFKDYDLLFYTDEEVFNDFDLINDNKIYKIRIICDLDEINLICDKLSELNLDINYYKNCIDNTYFVEIFRGSVNKFVGLEKICNKKILLDEVVAIGYDDTDIEILTGVGYSAIVSNGDNCIKKYADIVTLSNDNKGVEKILDKIM